jgi:hypothetical protein
VSDDVLEVIARYRAAARRILEAPGDLAGPRGRYLALVRLVQRIDAEPDRVVRAWAREAVWRDVRHLFAWRPEIDDHTPPLRHDERVRLMVRAGYRECPIGGCRLGPGALRGEAS